MQIVLFFFQFHQIYSKKYKKTIFYNNITNRFQKTYKKPGIFRLFGKVFGLLIRANTCLSKRNPRLDIATQHKQMVIRTTRSTQSTHTKQLANCEKNNLTNMALKNNWNHIHFSSCRLLTNSDVTCVATLRELGVLRNRPRLELFCGLG